METFKIDMIIIGEQKSENLWNRNFDVVGVIVVFFVVLVFVVDSVVVVDDVVINILIIFNFFVCLSLSFSQNSKIILK